MSAFRATSRASRIVFQAASVPAGVCALLPLLLGQILLATGLFVTLFAICWLAVGPTIFMVAGVVDLTRAIHRTVDGCRPSGVDEVLPKAGRLAVVAHRGAGCVAAVPDAKPAGGKA